MSNYIKYIDLHSHSTASDGTYTPSELISHAYNMQLAAIALSDHDTMDGIPEAIQQTATLDIELIPAIEMSALYNNIEIHLLGYMLNSFHKKAVAINSDLEIFMKERLNRNLEIIKRLQKIDINISMEDLYFGNPGAQITRAHFARLLVEKGIVKDRETAFKKYLKAGGPFCPRKTNTVELIMAFLNKHGFFISLAHPYQYKLAGNELNSLVSYLTEQGMKGLEVYHSTHHSKDIMQLRKLALKYNLQPTGGSDFHGANKPNIQLGIGYGHLKIPYSILEDMKQCH